MGWGRIITIIAIVSFMQKTLLVSGTNKNKVSKEEEFDYHQYWENAKELARLEPSQLTDYKPATSCVKVFVYDMPENIQGPLSFADVTAEKYIEENIIKNISAGKQAKQYDFYTPQWAEGIVFLHRLVVDNQLRKGCYLTTDPQKADLFFIPLFLNDGKWGGEFCKNERRGHAHLNKEMHLELLKLLIHLRGINSCSHFMFHPQAINNARSCRSWFASPKGQFSRMLRVAGSPIHQYEEFRHADPLTQVEMAFIAKSKDEFPYLVPAFHPSSVHWSNKFTDPPPWGLSNRTRPILMLYTTATKLHGDIPLRKKIMEDCQSYHNERVCTLDQEKRILLKKEAVFCLEPMGDNPYRKSIIDSITYGCIPVLFSKMTDAMSPYHWHGWRNRTRVLVSRKDFLKGKIDLKQLLQSIPVSLLKTLQHSIARAGKRFQTSLSYDPGDGQSLILRGLLDQKKKCEQDFRERGKEIGKTLESNRKTKYFTF